jgi:hypothetical protein
LEWNIFPKSGRIIPLPDGFDPNTQSLLPVKYFTMQTARQSRFMKSSTARVVGNRITTACWPYDRIMSFGSYVFTGFQEVTIGVVSGYTGVERWSRM